MYVYILRKLYIALLNVAETTHVAYLIFLLDQDAKTLDASLPAVCLGSWTLYEHSSRAAWHSVGLRDIHSVFP